MGGRTKPGGGASRFGLEDMHRVKGLARRAALRAMIQAWCMAVRHLNVDRFSQDKLRSGPGPEFTRRPSVSGILGLGGIQNTGRSIDTVSYRSTRIYCGSFKPCLPKSSASFFVAAAVFLARVGALFNSPRPTCWICT